MKLRKPQLMHYAHKNGRAWVSFRMSRYKQKINILLELLGTNCMVPQNNFKSATSAQFSSNTHNIAFAKTTSVCNRTNHDQHDLRAKRVFRIVASSSLKRLETCPYQSCLLPPDTGKGSCSEHLSEQDILNNNAPKNIAVRILPGYLL